MTIQPRWPRQVGGLDGCRNGWVLVTLDTLGAASPAPECATAATVRRIATFAEVADRTRLPAHHPEHLSLLAVDMPIGLTDAGPRACDSEARRRLGPRRASVFPAPIRPVLDAADHAEATARHRAVDGRGLSIQAWNLVPKIREVDDWITAADQLRVVETHPELAFAALAGGAPRPDPKRSPAGRADRERLLRPYVGALAHLSGAARDDVLDAAALALAAATLVRAGGLASLLRDAPRDARGLAMVVAPR